MLADLMTPSNELTAVIVAVAAAINAIFTYLLHRSGTAASRANTQAIQAVHDVAVTTARVAAPVASPEVQTAVAVAQKAVEALPTVTSTPKPQ